MLLIMQMIMNILNQTLAFYAGNCPSMYSLYLHPETPCVDIKI